MAKAQNPTISAKVPPEILLVVDQAAEIRGCPRQRIVMKGAVQYANLIVAEASARTAAARKNMRRAKARLGGLARHKK